MFHVCLLLKEGKGVLGSEKHYPVRNISVVWCGQLLQADTVIDQVFVAAWVQRLESGDTATITSGHQQIEQLAPSPSSSQEADTRHGWSEAAAVTPWFMFIQRQNIFCFVLHFVASLSYSFQDIPVISPQKAKQCSDFWQTGSVMWPQDNLQC